jgi:hypothetical protein
MPNLSEADLGQLQRLAGCMIPAAPAYGAPGADDPAIFADIASVLQQSPAPLDGLIADLAAASLDEAQVGELRQRHGAAFAMVIMALAQCYYRDDRVMRSLGLEARPPAPLGHKINEGDWSLLDDVRGRARIWRGAD